MSWTAAILNDTGPFDIDILRKIEHDIKSEWEGDEPGINFFLLLFALFAFVVWIVFISFFFSRLLGVFVAHWMRKFLKWSGVTDIAALSIGAFSVSILSGKIMIHDFLIVTGDFTLRINDGWIIFSYWKYLPKDCTVQECMNASRLHITMNGLKVHVFNRMSVYQNIAKQVGLAHMFGGATGGKETATAAKGKSNSEMLEMQLDAWWDNLWRLFGAVRIEITSARLIAGNNVLPSACMVTFESWRSRIFLTDASNKEDDRYMFRLKATTENVKVSLIKATDFVGGEIAGIKEEDPPRTMGDGFIVLQSAMLQLYYHQDLLGLVKEDRQSANLKVPVWETVWRLDRNTIFSYGPWADKQRALIYAFFFPSDYGCVPVTELPRKGQRRVLINHDVRVSLLHDASIDFWFMRAEELNAVHSRVKQGSSFEFYIPFITTDAGYTSEVRGSLLCLESTTSLPFREFINCETLRFNVTMRCPRAYNHQQVWDISMELHRFSTYFLWDHKRFVMDMINEWNASNTPDLCKFVPCIYNVTFNVVDQFEILLLLNDKNWVDTVSTHSQENAQAAVVGAQFHMSFALEFTEFDAADVCTFELSAKAERDVAVRAHLPPDGALAATLAALIKTARTHRQMRASGVRVDVCPSQRGYGNLSIGAKSQAYFNSGENGKNDEDFWSEVLRTELLTIKCEYEFHALIKPYPVDVPLPYAHRWMPTVAASPWQLAPDNLFVEINVDSSELLLTGLFLKMFLNFKDNYFSAYDQTSDAATRPLHAANTSFLNMEPPADVQHYRTMNTLFRFRMKALRAHCMNYGYLDEPGCADFCPEAILDEVVIELKKKHSEFLIQVVTSPITVEFATETSDRGQECTTRSVQVDGFQFRGHSLCSDYEVPWSVEVLEYGWLVEVLVGDCSGEVRPKDLAQAIQFIESFTVLALFSDEETEMPERSNLCQHFQNLKHCSRLGQPTMVDTRRSIRRANNCASFESLKYRSVRVSVNMINLTLIDEGFATNLHVERVRFAYCNAHGGVFADNFLAEVGTLKLSQLIKAPVFLDPEQVRWLRCGHAQTAGLHVDYKVPNAPAEASIADGRRAFLQRHDKAAGQRLYFLWAKPTTIETPRGCACYGNTRFFADKDTTGALFFTSSECLAPAQFVPNSVAGAQPAYQQSILDDNSSTLSGWLTHKDSTVSLVDRSTNMNTITNIDHSTRKISNASFHSASSFTQPESYRSQQHSQPHDEYGKFLEVLKRSENATFSPLSSGIRGLHLVRRDQRDTGSYDTVSGASDGSDQETAANSNSNCLNLRVNFGRQIEIFVSVLSLEALERLMSQFAETARRRHPAALVECIYRGCADRHHDQPLTVDFNNIDICFLKCCRQQSSNKSGINAVVLAQIPASNWHVRPPVGGGASCQPAGQHVHAAADWHLANCFAEILQIIDKNDYDNVFDKTPTSVTTNWAQIASATPQLRDSRVKTVLDVNMPSITISGTLAKVLTRRAGEPQICAGNRLTIDVPLLNIIAVSSKSTEDSLIKGNYGTLKRQSNERSLFEVLAPLLSAWCRAVLKCSTSISEAIDSVRKCRDLMIIRLLADALDWHDDATIYNSDGTSCLNDVKLHYRNVRSCGSCRLVYNLLQYSTQQGVKIDAAYWQRVIENDALFRNENNRKTAIIALLSHWQTVICTEIQLADNKLAHKYKYHAPSKSYRFAYSNTDSAAQNGSTNLNDAIPPNDQTLSAQHTAARPLSADAATATTLFRPSHHRGPSTATQITASAGNENEPQDLYHWILKAHKEYKDRRIQFGISDKTFESNEIEINSMELLLSAFFWTVYKELELERYTLDALPAANVHVDFGWMVGEVRVSLVEKKFLLSQHNEILVALSSHNLLTLENFELAGKLSTVTKPDEYQLRLAWFVDNLSSLGSCTVDYTCKIQDVRLIVSLVSVVFINDVTMLVRFLIGDLDAFLQKLRVANERVGSLARSSAATINGDYESWPGGVLDKLQDYERSWPYKRRDFLHCRLTGNWSVKMLAFESMITDLFISMTLLKLQFQQSHTRLSSCGDRSSASVGNEMSGGTLLSKSSRIADNCSQKCKDLIQLLLANGSDGESVNISDGAPLPLALDRLNVALRRANLIVAEHVVTNQRNSDTRQILNCTLRETKLVYERFIERFRPTVPIDFTSSANSAITNKVDLALGELEADLPMHAQSIHEMVLRHGPHLNEQFHRIVGQPQLIASENFVQPLTIGADIDAIMEASLPASDEYVNALAYSPTPVQSRRQPPDGGDASSSRVSVEQTASSPTILPSLQPDQLAENSKSTKLAEIEFSVRLAGIELNAKLLSLLKAKYKLQSASGNGRSGKIFDFSAEVSNHQLSFQVTTKDGGATTPTMSAAPIDRFTLQLPRVSATGAYRNDGATTTASGWNSAELTQRAGGYYDVTIIMGSIVHTFSTDLLNQILFAEQSFRSELSFLIERLSSERPKTPGGASFLNINPILFNLEIKGEGVPWLQITATTPTSIAIRFTIDCPSAMFTNRLIRRASDSSDEDHRLFGQAKIQLNMKLGQLYKTALYEETQDELEEYANFMTQISIQNEDSMATNSMHKFAILLSRPFLLVKSNAIDKAILLWLNYRNTYTYWRKEREKLLRSSHRAFDAKSHRPPAATAAATATNFAADMNINLSLSIRNGLYVCMPLYSSEPSDNLAALMLSLQRSDVTVCVKKELACNATFNAFKVSLIDNFDEQTLSEPWLYESGDDATIHSNYFFFPHGAYKFCTSAVSPTADERNAKWILSVKSDMKGMIIDFDYKIGKLANLLVQTLTSSFAFDGDDNEMMDDYAPSGSSYVFRSLAGAAPAASRPSRGILLHKASSALTGMTSRGAVDAADALHLLDDKKFAGLSNENRTRLLERKMHEQSVLVTDLMNLSASEFAIEKERRKLRILELARFKNFRQSMWDKLRQKVDRHQSTVVIGDTLNGASGETAKRQLSKCGNKRQAPRSLLVVRPTVGENGPDNMPATGNNSPASGQRQNSQAQPTSTDSVDMNIDVQINIECGQCILRANHPTQAAAAPLSGLSMTPGQRLLAKKPSARDLRAKTTGSAIGSQLAVTKLAIPSLNANMFYTSNDPMATPPSYVAQLFPQEKPSPAASCPNINGTMTVTEKNKCFYMTLELASMPLETLITPSLADFLEQVVEPLPESLFEPSAKMPLSGTETSNNDSSSVPIVAIDTSSLPLDVLFHMSVQSSAIRFESQQQRSSAADCLLTLPGLTLMASTRKNDDPDRFSLAGIYLSATLSSFSLNVYSPHQQSSAHDAFSLTLDRLSISSSRSKGSFHMDDDDRNRVELVILSNVGSATLNYDMRRLSELLTFPRPWYRKQLVRRLFFGEHSLTANNNAGGGAAPAAEASRDACSSSDASPTPSESRRSTPRFQAREERLKVAARTSPPKEKEWAATVVFSMQWKELNVNAQMSNTMGNTVWLARNGVFRGHLQLDSRKHRDVAISFDLQASELSAQGGAISGEASIARLSASARHTKRRDVSLTTKAPENQLEFQIDSVESRVEWMSRPIFIGRFIRPKIRIADEWKSRRDEKTGEIAEALCLINISCYWQDLQMIITKNTVSDMTKIGQKLIFFFKDQLTSSRLAWDREFFDVGSSTSSDDDNQPPLRHSATESKSFSSFEAASGRHASFHSVSSSISADSSSSTTICQSSAPDFPTTTHWQRILDRLSEIQLHQKFLALPTADDGITYVGGNIELNAERLSVACINGEMNASSWALFHMKEIGTLFEDRASYTFLDEEEGAEDSDIGIRIRHRFTFMLGEGREGLCLFPNETAAPTATAKPSTAGKQSQSACNAVVCRVQHRGFMMRHNASIDLLLEEMIGDVLKQLQLGDPTSSAAANEPPKPADVTAPPHFTHSVLRLFMFPALEAVLETVQHRDLHETNRRRRRRSRRQSSPQNQQNQPEDGVRPVISTVRSTFVCTFRDAVCVQTDFNAQVGFLPELLKSYIITLSEPLSDVTPRHNVSSSSLRPRRSGTSKHDPFTSFTIEHHDAESRKDPRNYLCTQWVVDPKIMFIDRFKWNPPVIDEILRKLQIFDHRQTIPKVLQRGLLDRCDLLIAVLEQTIINQCRNK